MSAPTSPRPTSIIVDDDPDTLEILRRLFRDLAAHYEIVTVGTGSEALAALNGRTVPLVITGYEMPDMDGIALASAIKHVSPTTEIVMIAVYNVPSLERPARGRGGLLSGQAVRVQGDSAARAQHSIETVDHATAHGGAAPPLAEERA